MNLLRKFILSALMGVGYVTPYVTDVVEFELPGLPNTGLIRIYHDMHVAEFDSINPQRHAQIEAWLCEQANRKQPPLFLWEIAEQDQTECKRPESWLHVDYEHDGTIDVPIEDELYSFNELLGDLFMVSCGVKVKDALNARQRQDLFINVDTVRGPALALLMRGGYRHMSSWIRTVGTIIATSDISSDIERLRAEGSRVPLSVFTELKEAYGAYCKQVQIWFENLPFHIRYLHPMVLGGLFGVNQEFPILWPFLDCATLAKAIFAAYNGQDVVIFVGALHGYNIGCWLEQRAGFKQVFREECLADDLRSKKCSQEEMEQHINLVCLENSKKSWGLFF